jgi:SAM-dependent methyltransferase
VRKLCPECEQLPWSKDAVRRCICVGMNLDVGSSDHPQKGFLGMDRRELPGVSFVWDVESPAEPPSWAVHFGAKAMPWPFPDGCVDKMLMSHLFEHIAPSATLAVMDEVWRVMKFDGQLLMVLPHGDSYGYRQDPTHQNMCVEATFAYWDPAHASGLWNVYKPKPWKIARLHSNPLHNIEVILEPRKKIDGSIIDITLERAATKLAKRRRTT